MSTTNKKKTDNGWASTGSRIRDFNEIKQPAGMMQKPAGNADIPNTGNYQAPSGGLVGSQQGLEYDPSLYTGTIQPRATGQTGFAGVSGNKNTSNGYYTPSQNVLSAQAGLNAIIANQPKDFSSQYTDQLDGILNQILGRGPFEYDLENDPMFQQFRQQYMQAGQNAMQDTMGQAAALTGGYGSSYATTAGQQAYNQHLQQLNDRIPELHQMALDAYNAEGDVLNQNYALVSDAYGRDYAEWQDAYNRWLSDRDFEQGRYEADRNYSLQSQALALDKLAMEQDQANADRQYQSSERNYYYSVALDMIGMGITPPDSILQQAGLSADQIAALRATGGSGSSGGSSKKKGSGSGSSSSKDYETYMALLGLGNKLGTKTGSGSSSDDDPNWLAKAGNTAKDIANSASSLQAIFNKYNK